jgi:hypothetical protein
VGQQHLAAGVVFEIASTVMLDARSVTTTRRFVSITAELVLVMTQVPRCLHSITVAESCDACSLRR